MPAMSFPARADCASCDGARQAAASAADIVIYFARAAQGVIWMLTIYPKNVAENIPAHVLRQIRKEVENG